MSNQVDKVIKAEGGDQETNDPSDSGGRTKFGISEAANPDLWVEGPPSEEASRRRYEEKYVLGPRFNLIRDPYLQHQMVDFGVHSGPATATKKLQEILRLPQDGIIGPKTLEAIHLHDAKLLGNKLALARTRLLVRIAQQRPKDLKFLYGWVDRALSFVRE